MPTRDGENAVAARRTRLLGGALAIASGAGITAFPAAAQTKVSKKIANYQITPQDHQRCDGCIQWLQPASCKVVAGAISPSGWCSLYAPKPKS